LSNSPPETAQRFVIVRAVSHESGAFASLRIVIRWIPECRSHCTGILNFGITAAEKSLQCEHVLT
jgi:hypothetical protein